MIDHKTLRDCFAEEFDLMRAVEDFSDEVETALYGKPLGEDGPFGNNFAQYLYEIIQLRLNHYNEYIKLKKKIKSTYSEGF